MAELELWLTSMMLVLCGAGACASLCLISFSIKALDAKPKLWIDPWVNSWFGSVLFLFTALFEIFLVSLWLLLLVLYSQPLFS